MIFTIAETIKLIAGIADYNSARFLVGLCRQSGMKELEYIDELLPAAPEFDKGYVFSYLTDDNEDAILTIYEKDIKINDIRVQITYKPSLFKFNFNVHYSQIVDLIEYYYEGGYRTDMGNKTIKYENLKSACYIAKFKSHGRAAIGVMAANKEFYPE